MNFMARWAFIAILLLATPAWAHPAHVTIAEAEYVRERGTVEVSLRVRPEDLVAALEAARTPAATQNGEPRRPLNLERTPEIDTQIADYLRRVFTLGEEAGAAKLIWVGKEQEGRYLWLYFELRLPGAAPESLAGLPLSNRALFEALENQANTVVLQDGARRVSLRFTLERPRQTIPGEPSVDEPLGNRAPSQPDAPARRNGLPSRLEPLGNRARSPNHAVWSGSFLRLAGASG